ncbi:MAG: VanZ family protein [Acutalibacteraceae bacterium]
MKHSKKRKIYITLSVIVVILVCAVIFLLSAQNGYESTKTSNSILLFLQRISFNIFTPEAIRTTAHFCEYGLLSFLVTNLYWSVKGKINFVFAILTSWGYAWLDEIHQYFVPGRAFQLYDLTVDLSGIFLGTFTFWFLYLFIKKYRKDKIIKMSVERKSSK